MRFPYSKDALNAIDSLMPLVFLIAATSGVIYGLLFLRLFKKIVVVSVSSLNCILSYHP